MKPNYVPYYLKITPYTLSKNDVPWSKCGFKNLIINLTAVLLAQWIVKHCERSVSCDASFNMIDPIEIVHIKLCKKTLLNHKISNIVSKLFSLKIKYFTDY